MKNKMTEALNRRDFLTYATAAAVSMKALYAAPTGNSKGVDRLACNSWPFRFYFDTPQMHEYRNAKYPLLTQEEFPQFLADHFGIHNVEFLSGHFADTSTATIDKVKAGLKKAGSRCCNLMDVGIPGGGPYVKGLDRNAVIKAAERWVGVAVALGSPSITVPLDGKGTPDAKTAADNLAPLVDVAHKRGIRVLFHNDSLKTEPAEILTAVIKQLGTDKTGTCLDFGNFATKSAAYSLAQIKMLVPYASNICHSKDGIADNGKFYADDFEASMKLMRDNGFKGVYSLEFEGLGEPIDGVNKLKSRTLEYLS